MASEADGVCTERHPCTQTVAYLSHDGAALLGKLSAGQAHGESRSVLQSCNATHRTEYVALNFSSAEDFGADAVYVYVYVGLDGVICLRSAEEFAKLMEEGPRAVVRAQMQ